MKKLMMRELKYCEFQCQSMNRGIDKAFNRHINEAMRPVRRDVSWHYHLLKSFNETLDEEF